MINIISYIFFLIAIVYSTMLVKKRDKTYKNCLLCKSEHNPFTDTSINYSSNIMICGVCKRDIKFNRLSLPFRFGSLLNYLDKLDTNRVLKSYMIPILLNVIVSVMSTSVSYDSKVLFALLSSILVTLSGILMIRYTKNNI